MNLLLRDYRDKNSRLARVLRQQRIRSGTSVAVLAAALTVLCLGLVLARLLGVTR